MAHFLKNYHELADAPRIQARISRGLANVERQRQRREAVKIKMAGTKYPQFDLKIPYPVGYQKHIKTATNGNPKPSWLEEEDR